MIFITIGTQEPFDRLIEKMDQIAGQFPEIKFIAQTINSDYKTKYLTTVDFLNPQEFEKIFNEAKLIVSHAGMGTIISALSMKKPIIVVPRLVKFGEHRNEHQLSTANKMNELGYVRVAFDMIELENQLINLIHQENIQPIKEINRFASDQLLSSLQNLVSKLQK